MIRQPSPRNPAQKKSRVEIKRQVVDGEVHLLCRSEGRTEKDRAIRATHEQRFLGALQKLQARVATGRLRQEAKVHEAIGRLKERLRAGGAVLRHHLRRRAAGRDVEAARGPESEG